MDDLLNPGMVFYKCGLGNWKGKSDIFISSWMYLGIQKLSSNTTKCDTPYHYYKFVECESYFRRQRDPSVSMNIMFVPSMEYVQNLLVPLSELPGDISLLQLHKSEEYDIGDDTGSGKP